MLVNDGELMGFLKADGTFAVNFVPSGSHLVEIVSPNYVFEKVRVDITKGGKIRARRANFVQPNAVQVVPYPLRFHADGQAPFFEIRETWKITDVLFNPMVCHQLRVFFSRRPVNGVLFFYISFICLPDHSSSSHIFLLSTVLFCNCNL